MNDIMKKLVLLLCFATVSLATQEAFAKRRFPTRPKQNESIEESIGRLKYDEARGRRMLASNDSELKTLVGPEKYASIRAGTCPNMRCVNGATRRRAQGLERRRAKLETQLSEISQERIALTAMYVQMNAPLASNTLTQPGVTQQQPAAPVTPASNANGTPGAPATNPLMPVDPAAAPGAPAAPVAPGAPPAAPPGPPVTPPIGNGAALSPTSNGASY